MSPSHVDLKSKSDKRDSYSNERGRGGSARLLARFRTIKRWIFMYNKMLDVIIYDPRGGLFYELVHNVLQDLQSAYPGISLHVAGESVSGIIFCYGVQRTRRNSFALKIWACNPITGKVWELTPHFELNNSTFKRCTVSVTPVPNTSSTVTKLGCYKLFVVVKPLGFDQVVITDLIEVGIYHSELRYWESLDRSMPSKLKIRLSNYSAVRRFRQYDENIYLMKPSLAALLRREYGVLRFADSLSDMFRYNACEEEWDHLVQECRRTQQLPTVSWINAFERSGQLLWTAMEGDEAFKCTGFRIYTRPLMFDEQKTMQCASMLSSIQCAFTSSPLPHQPTPRMTSRQRTTSRKLASMPASIFRKLHGEPQTGLRNMRSEDVAAPSSSNSSCPAASIRNETECSCKNHILVFPVADDFYGDHILFLSALTGRIATFNLEHLGWELTSIRAAATAETPDEIESAIAPSNSVYRTPYRIADFNRVKAVVESLDFQAVDELS